MNIRGFAKSFLFNLRHFGGSLVRPSIGPRTIAEGSEMMMIGERFSCGRDCFLSAAEGGVLIIGNRVSLNSNVHINAAHAGEIIIGSDVLIGPNVVIRGANHRTSDTTRPIREQGHKAHPTSIGSNVWIGANVVVCAGARIPSNCIVPAGKVVTRWKHQEEIQYISAAEVHYAAAD